MESKIYIADLNAYNEGRLEGEWIDLPCEQNKLVEIVNKYSNNGQNDYAIHDYEYIPFSVGETSNPFEINRLLQQLEKTIEQLEKETNDDDLISDVICYLIDNYIRQEKGYNISIMDRFEFVDLYICNHEKQAFELYCNIERFFGEIDAKKFLYEMFIKHDEGTFCDPRTLKTIIEIHE